MLKRHPRGSTLLLAYTTLVSDHPSFLAAVIACTLLSTFQLACTVYVIVRFVSDRGGFKGALDDAFGSTSDPGLRSVVGNGAHVPLLNARLPLV